MDDDLKPEITSMIDTHIFERGAPMAVTRVTFYLGKLGPFQREFPRGVQRDAIERAMREQQDAIPRSY